jgi:hypothetical protein
VVPSPSATLWERPALAFSARWRGSYTGAMCIGVGQGIDVVLET